jgi:serine/threonine protein phosphatase PrpC
MEDYHVAKFVHEQGHELGLFAIYDGHLGDSVPAYLQKHLFPNILKDVSIRSKLWHYLFRYFPLGLKGKIPF